MENIIYKQRTCKAKNAQTKHYGTNHLSECLCTNLKCPSLFFTLCMGTPGLHPQVHSAREAVMLVSRWQVRHLPFSSHKPKGLAEFISDHCVCPPICTNRCHYQPATLPGNDIIKLCHYATPPAYWEKNPGKCACAIQNPTK